MYIFYDTETSDLSREFAQVFQAALIFTDDDFNMLSGVKLECKRMPWVVPSPAAMLITGFTPDDLKQNNVSQAEMMGALSDWVKSQHWPLTFVGYNNMGYDETVLRHNLEQSLQNPYLTTGRKQWGDEPNGRMDVLTLVRAVQAYMPGLLKLDEKNDYGTPSLTLENVARQNGVPLSADDAHDAMADTKATIGVARLIKTGAPDLWDHMKRLSTREGVEEFFQQNPVFAQTDYAGGKPVSALVTPVEVNPKNNSEVVLFDLSQDPERFFNMSVKELADELARLRERDPDVKYKDQAFRTVRKNQSPLVMPLALADAVAPANVSDSDLMKRADKIARNTTFKKKIADAMELNAKAFAQQYKNAAQQQGGQATPVPKQPEQQIYDFPPAEVRKDLQKWMQDFLTSVPADRVAMIEDFDKKFQQGLVKKPSLSRFKEFAERIVYAETPEALPEKTRKRMVTDIAKRILDPNTDVPWMTVAKARLQLAEIEEQRAKGDKKWKNVTDTQIRSLKLYYTSMEKEYGQYLPPEKRPPAAMNDDQPDQQGANRPKPPNNWFKWKS